ncbi:MAG: GDP-mannose 4,6-dehydratase, partial [candidate division Zixibacteria bacterium]|nr:GDP-mannose 4,6-dehydratase [candidate division Zixibacteria bacterium]
SLIGIPYSYHAPDSYVDTNIRGTVNLLQAARAVGVERFVHTSTSEVYGTARRVPIDETHPQVGQSPYSASKIAADQLAVSFHRSFDLPVVIARPFNTYGPRQSARAVIPTIITQLLDGDGTVKLGATAPTRDFTYVTDTAAGLVAAATADNVLGETINIGSGDDIGIGELAELIGRLMNREIRIVNDPDRTRPAASEVDRLVCDVSRARNLLDWSPRKTLSDGLTETIAWFSRPENLKRYRPGWYGI